VDISHTPSYGLDKSGRAEVGNCWYSKKIQFCILISWSWLVGSMVFGLPFCPKGCGPQVDLDPDPAPDVEIAL
jgi:hypothetical protein